ncbi:MAG: acetyl-CoA C-acetyltransferase [Bacillota bacterium]
MPRSVIVAAARTPFGSFGGSLKDIPATDLGGHVIKDVVRRSGLKGEEIDYVYMGQVIQAGAGQVPSRQATIKAGLPTTVPSDTINKVCASSLRAVNLADMMIRVGEAQIVVAGGMENMSQGPYLLPKGRFGYRLGDGAIIDATVHDGLWCAIHNCHMGVHGGRVAGEFGITRQAMDEWSYRSHQRALKAIKEGKFKDEIAPVTIPQRKGPAVVFDTDEGPRAETTLDKISGLPPVFEKDGLITAGNAPPISDGASAVVVMSEERAKALGLEPLATILSHGWVSQDAPYLHTVPHLSGMQALKKAGLSQKDVNLVEFNEAFAAVTLTAIKLGGWDPEIVNVNGGAVALGHPIGASGARILMSAIYELRRRGGGVGLVGICSGGGQGEATVFRVG